ncbi:unnamed protein product [Toxocara canis]|uniref:UBIQUITIN_CONJUGAT_2 domain-containing protein n=1 Tax=Toxocara canis TaxID=6265 RepID=A0A183UJT5_TOXCA|nr:unnamed protein product [Toxocara canis]
MDVIPSWNSTIGIIPAATFSRDIILWTATTGWCIDLKKSPVEGFSAGLRGDGDDIYKWECDVIFSEGGLFKAELDFPKDYPQRPPKMRFTSEIWHPNIDKEGNVCISILHQPGDDQWGYEKPEERWLPVHTVETILLSVISMLAEPNCNSPANVDAAVGHFLLLFIRPWS